MSIINNSRNNCFLNISSKYIAFLSLLLILVFANSVFANPVKKKFKEATAAFVGGQYEEAILLYEETLKLYPNFAPAYNFIGMSHKEMGGDVNTIIEMFNKSIEIDPNYVLAYDNLGKLYYNLGEFDLAKKNCLKAIELKPDYMSAKMSLGWIYLLGLSDANESIGYFKSVAEQDKLPYAYFGLGIAYYTDGQRLKIMDVITHLREINEEDFARQLETMVREGKYIQPRINGMPLIAPPKGKAVIINDDIPSLADVKPLSDIPVRVLKKRASIKHESYEERNALTGAERIRQLQNNPVSP